MVLSHKVLPQTQIGPSLFRSSVFTFVQSGPVKAQNAALFLFVLVLAMFTVIPPEAHLKHPGGYFVPQVLVLQYELVFGVERYCVPATLQPYVDVIIPRFGMDAHN